MNLPFWYCQWACTGAWHYLNLVPHLKQLSNSYDVLLLSLPAEFHVLKNAKIDLQGDAGYQDVIECSNSLEKVMFSVYLVSNVVLLHL